MWLSCGCAPLVDGEPGGDGPGTAVANIMVVPPRASCIAVSLTLTSDGSTVWRGFEVVPGARARLDFGHLDPGARLVRGWSMTQDCDKFGVDDGPSLMRLNTEAEWVADAVTVNVTQTGHTNIPLVFRRNGSVGATADFLPAEGVEEVFSGPAAYGTFARMADGGILAWGRNDYRQLGDGTATERWYPVRTSYPVGIGRMSMSRTRSCGLTDAGMPWCAGASEGGGGASGTPSELDPTSVIYAVSAHDRGNIDSYRAMAIGGSFLLHAALPTLGSSYSQPAADERLVQIVPNDALPCVITARGRVLCAQDPGTSIPGCTAPSSTQLVQTFGAAVTAAARAAQSACAVRLDGSVECCGTNTVGQLGDVLVGADVATRVNVRGLPAVRSISAGESHYCAIAADATVWCWGNNAVGQLGRGFAGPFSAQAQRVTGLTGVTSLAAGREHTCARTTDGRVSCWGGNTYGQLGDGTISPRYTPVLAGR